MIKNSLGEKVTEPTQDILDFFAPLEGDNCLYFGRVRNGKTYSATADILDLLKRGEIVYAISSFKTMMSVSISFL